MDSVMKARRCMDSQKGHYDKLSQEEICTVNNVLFFNRTFSRKLLIHPTNDTV